MAKKFRPDVDAPEYKGRYYPYDIIKEGTIALVVVSLLVVGLAILFGSPDDPAVTLKEWSTAQPVDFATTALSELNGTSGVAGYGPPYNTAQDGQKIGPFPVAKWVGVHIPVDTAQDFVLMPLTTLPDVPALTSGLRLWSAASEMQKTVWLDAYAKGTMSFANGKITDTATGAGPVPLFITELTSMARTGALDADLIAGHGYYTTDYTKPLLFLSDGQWFPSIAANDHLSGDQWGMMNELGNYPGQAWLWLYTMWYQVPPYSTSWADNADAMVWATMMVLTALLALLPFIPGLRSIPRWTRVYRLIWREHYRATAQESGATSSREDPPSTPTA